LLVCILETSEILLLDAKRALLIIGIIVTSQVVVVALTLIRLTFISVLSIRAITFAACTLDKEFASLAATNVSAVLVVGVVTHVCEIFVSASLEATNVIELQ
jgi:hypothetical protein